MTTVVVFDYGSGNIHSVVRAIQGLGVEVILTADADQALAADGLVVPGVGAFAACMEQLTSVGGDRIIRERVQANLAILGICVGHQILFSAGIEHGIPCKGVGIFTGTIQQLPTTKLPHMGWNEVASVPRSRFFEGTQRFYFVHSYGALTPEDLPQDAVSLWTEHEGIQVMAAVEYGPVLSTQFHPEKSGSAGAALLKRWIDSLEVG
ncbi:MAG: imidazole glycerol phosphate synthase subunit HisH [Propionibacteriaceae bacterium]|nr:imidazole glycerol phosphate synthase subunit HisH [Propionibacteriaceae bacterium]